MSLELYVAYVLACAVIALVPGPTVTVIVANSLRYGARAGLLNVAGTQAGLALMMLILVVGLSSVVAAMGWFFEWLRWAGAAYLVWLGYKLLRYVAQIVGLGVTAMAVALVSDGAYAVLTGRAGAFLSRQRLRFVSRLSGGFLVGGGVWLALTRAR